METEKLPGIRGCDNKMAVHTFTQTKYVSIYRKHQEQFSYSSCKNGVVDQGNYLKSYNKWNCTE